MSKITFLPYGHEYFFMYHLAGVFLSARRHYRYVLCIMCYVSCVMCHVSCLTKQKRQLRFYWNYRLCGSLLMVTSFAVR